MNVREKAIIANLLSDNTGRSNNQLEQLFYSDLSTCGDDIRDIRGAVQKTIRCFFSDPCYHGKFGEIYDVVVSMLFINIKKAGTGVFDNVKKTLKVYLNAMVHNICANPTSRKEINSSIGINPYDDPFSFSNDIDEDNNANEPLEPEQEGFAEGLLEYYISLLPSESDRELLRAIDIEGKRNKDYAAEHGVSAQAVNSQHKRATIALTMAVLPVIREDCRDIFERTKAKIPAADAELLARFFNGDRAVDSKEVAQAMWKLVKKYNGEIQRKQQLRYERYLEYQESMRAPQAGN